MKMLKDKNYLVIIKPDYSRTYEELVSVPNLDILKKALDGGMLEIVPYLNKFMGRSCVAFCDEEGKLKNLPLNVAAQEVWEVSFGKTIRNDYLVGPIAIVVGSKSFLELL